MATHNSSASTEPTYKEQEAAKEAEFFRKYGHEQAGKDVVFMALDPLVPGGYPLIRGARHGTIVSPVTPYTKNRKLMVKDDKGRTEQVRGLLDEGEHSLLGVRRTIDSMNTTEQQPAQQGATKEKQASDGFGEWGGGTKTKRRRKKRKTKRRRKKRKTKRRRKKRKTKRRRKTHSTR